MNMMVVIPNIIENDHLGSNLTSPNDSLQTSTSSSLPSITSRQLYEKLDRNRARNKEHAKKTRMRKKEMIENLKIKLSDLQQEVSFIDYHFCFVFQSKKKSFFFFNRLNV